jgi:hypothetical protein
VDDRSALAIGVRVQLSWVQHAPYTRRADLAVSDRLAMIDGRDGGAWIAVDTHGDRHCLEDDQLEAAEPDPARGRWRIEGAIPAYDVGERLRLHWRHRSTAIVPDPPRADCHATVVAEAADVVTARLDDGTQIILYRWGAQADESDRSAPRWFVAARA